MSIERILALGKRCFRKLLGISYRDPIINEEVKARIGNAIWWYEDLLTSVKRRKPKLYGHVTRSSGLAKAILQGTVQGGRRRGRQTKRWEDNIKEWTGLEWNMLQRKAENRQEWRKLVVNLQWCPSCQPNFGIEKITTMQKLTADAPTLDDQKHVFLNMSNRTLRISV